MIRDGKIWVGQSEGQPVFLEPSMAARHGLIAGATGTGKTVTLKVLAESFSALGIPVFLADVKGDLSGFVHPGAMSDKLRERMQSMQMDPNTFTFEDFPVTFWDVFGKKGHPVRTTITEMGPVLLSRMMELNDTQSGVLSIIFRYADEEGLALLDLKDLRAILQFAMENETMLSKRYGAVSGRSVSAILRALLTLEDQHADQFFGETALDIHDWMRTGKQGKGMINVLYSVDLYQYPDLYSTFLLWMLSELYETLPEVGDLPQPKMVFFFDEAHLLFRDIPKVLLEKIELVVRLIRSKGVGIYFATQNPADIPNIILSQLGNRFQHALRAYTPQELKSIRAAADSFRPNPAFSTDAVLQELKTGEALVSCLDGEGRPEIVHRTMMIAPQSSLTPISDGEYDPFIKASLLYGKYEQVIDRESAYEILQKKAEAQLEVKTPEKKEKAVRTTKVQKNYAQQTVERTINSAVTSVGREVGRQLIRGVLGSLFKK